MPGLKGRPKNFMVLFTVCLRVDMFLKDVVKRVCV